MWDDWPRSIDSEGILFQQFRENSKDRVGQQECCVHKGVCSPELTCSHVGRKEPTSRVVLRPLPVCMHTNTCFKKFKDRSEDLICQSGDCRMFCLMRPVLNLYHMPGVDLSAVCVRLKISAMSREEKWLNQVHTRRNTRDRIWIQTSKMPSPFPDYTILF